MSKPAASFRAWLLLAIAGVFSGFAWLAHIEPAHAVGVVVQSGPRLFTSSSSSSSGGLSDGATYSFTSGGSLASPPTVEFLGGKTGVIDAGTPGVHFTRTNWAQLNPTLSDWQWSTTRTRNRARTLYYDGAARGEGLGAGGNCRGTYQYDVGAGGWTSLYVSLNVYWQVNPSYPNFQWKMFRFQQQMDGSQPEVVDGDPTTFARDPQAYMSNSVNGAEMPFSTFTNADGQLVLFPGTGRAPQNGWFRMEIFMQENSPAGTANGTLRVRMTDSSGTVVQNITSSSRKFRGASDNSNPFRYFIWQLYGGNASDPGGSGATVPGNTDWGDSIWFMDDFYISPNSQARVEISDGASEPVIQKITSASGTARSIELNKGHLNCAAGACTLREYDNTNTLITTISSLTITQVFPTGPAANDDFFHMIDVARAA